MRRQFTITLSVAVVTLILVATQAMRAQNLASSQTSQINTASTAGMDEATMMVPAQAALLQNLDAKNDRSGQTFRMKLADTVHLKNGPELPRDTELIGTIADDDMQIHGTSMLVLRITKAELKDGTTIPVKATIVGFYGPKDETLQGGYPIVAGDQMANDWSKSYLKFDEIGALKDVDLHSSIGSRNSGVFVSTKKDNFELKAGSEIALAIAAQK